MGYVGAFAKEQGVAVGGRMPEMSSGRAVVVLVLFGCFPPPLHDPCHGEGKFVSFPSVIFGAEI
jgi:hypothetical protein